MLSAYVSRGASLERQVIDENGTVPEGAVWFDLVTPTLPEDKLLERALGIAVPTREEMQEIEVSSRLYVENGARYMTATLMCQTRRLRRRPPSPSSSADASSSRCATTSRSPSR
jgi:magnesium transporter